MPPALREAETESEKQLERIEELEQTLFELQGEIGAGRHLPPGVRVLSLRDNPAQQWEDLSKAAMDRLKGENEALLKRLKDPEESGIHGSGQAPNVELVPRESYEAVKKEKQELAEELKRRDKRLLRLQEVRLALALTSMIPCIAITGAVMNKFVAAYKTCVTFPLFPPACRADKAQVLATERCRRGHHRRGGHLDDPHRTGVWHPGGPRDPVQRAHR